MSEDEEEEEEEDDDDEELNVPVVCSKNFR